MSKPILPMLLLCLSLCVAQAHATETLRYGIASWYGQRFEGRRMANGCIFHRLALTAAMRSVPIGAWVRVRRAQRPEMIEVQITDRGPYHDNRLIDLSEGAAKRLDMRADGIARVSVEVIATGETGCARG